MFHLMPESSQSKDLRELLRSCYDKGFVVTLLYSLVSVFECKRILRSDAFFSNRYKPDVYDRLSHSSHASLPPTHPLLQLTV